MVLAEELRVFAKTGKKHAHTENKTIHNKDCIIYFSKWALELTTSWYKNKYT